MIYPELLERAQSEPGDYALRTKDGVWVYFETCECRGDYVRIVGHVDSKDGLLQSVEVKIDEISLVTCAAPEGAEVETVSDAE